MPLKEIKAARIQKLKKLQDEYKINPYPIKSRRSLACQEAIENSNSLMAQSKVIIVGGRVESIRKHGGSIFFHIYDESARLQIFLKKDVVGEKMFRIFQETIDIGDFIEAEGKLFFTKTKELTLKAEKWRILSKSIRPLPDNWYGLKNKEMRLRHRYLELLTNPSFKARLEIRALLIKTLRNFLDQEGFLEVETPILQNQAGGALARPFKTKLNALNIDLYLRIAPELYLKRLIVGGFEKIYELGKSFRNEGIDFSHNPEFTMVEFYWAYCDYEKLMGFTEKLFRELLSVLAKEADKYSVLFSKETGENLTFKDKILQIQKQFADSLPRLVYSELFKKMTQLDLEKVQEKELKEFLSAHGFEEYQEGDKWTLIDEIFKKFCLPQIKYPFFLVRHPLPLSPLAKRTEDGKAAARFQLVINSMEIVNAYSELNNPIEQRKRFEAQQERAEEGEKEIHPYDKDFIKALEYAMPPTAGWGMGIDRLAALLTGSRSIKEVIAFPLMKPKDEA